jgi:hypothetical protein
MDATTLINIIASIDPKPLYFCPELRAVEEEMRSIFFSKTPNYSRYGELRERARGLSLAQSIERGRRGR